MIISNISFLTDCFEIHQTIEDTVDARATILKNPSLYPPILNRNLKKTKERKQNLKINPI